MIEDNRSPPMDAAQEPASTNVVLLDPTTDAIVGQMEKLEAHRRGRYHAAMSILLFRDDNAQLVQRRALTKYHSPGLWANACCGHPMPGEGAVSAASRRVNEELGVIAPITEIGVIRYRSPVKTRDGTDLVEYEHVRLFSGRFEGEVHPNPDEVDAVKWTERSDARDIGTEADLTPWFRLYMNVVSPNMVTPDMGPIDFGFFDLRDDI